jgi:hypothetical protein
MNIFNFNDAIIANLHKLQVVQSLLWSLLYRFLVSTLGAAAAGEKKLRAKTIIFLTQLRSENSRFAAHSA